MQRIEERVVIDGKTALWTTSGGEGAPVALCHGGPGSYDYLGPVAALLETRCCVHRFDQRGGGRSIHQGSVTLGALIDDIEALRLHWGYEQWTVGGHSWGAHLAMFYALAHPDRVSALLLLNPTGIRWDWGPARRENRLQRLTPTERAEFVELERRLADEENANDRARLRALAWITDFANRDNALRNCPFNRYAPAPAVLAELERDWQAALDGIEPALAGLTVPAIVVHGECDPIPIAGPSQLASLLPNARFVSLPAAGHIPWLEQPEQLQNELRSFLRESGAAPAAPAPPAGGCGQSLPSLDRRREAR